MILMFLAREVKSRHKLKGGSPDGLSEALTPDGADSVTVAPAAAPTGAKAATPKVVATKPAAAATPTTAASAPIGSMSDSDSDLVE